MTDVYQASPVKRHRSTKAEVEQRRQDLFDIARAMRPMTVRQVFYQATVRDLVEKSESGYTKVQTDLVQMRLMGPRSMRSTALLAMGAGRATFFAPAKRPSAPRPSWRGSAMRSCVVATDLRTIARALGGKISGGQVLAPGPGHSQRDRSLAVRFDHRAPDGFVVASFAGDGWRECRDHVAARLGLRTNGRRWPALRRRSAAVQSRHAQSQALHERPLNTECEPSHTERTELSRWLWRQAQPIAGSPAERYLRDARGYRGPLPPTLRYLPARGGYPHAMAAAFGTPSEPEPGVLAMAEVAGLHLTRLAPDGAGKIGKITIGRGVVSPIVLAPPNDTLGLAITEGIEDALSLHAATGLGAWAAGSASRFRALADAIPEWIDCVTIAADADPAGRKGATALAAALRERGFRVEIRELGGAE